MLVFHEMWIAGYVLTQYHHHMQDVSQGKFLSGPLLFSFF